MGYNEFSGRPRFVLYTNSVSPHQIPLFRRMLWCLGGTGCYYVFTQRVSHERRALGWGVVSEKWVIFKAENPDLADDILESADLLMSTIRDCELFERRVKKGLMTVYFSERWFKPYIGMLRMLQPSFFCMAKRIVEMLRNEPSFYYLPIGIHAATDMARLCGLLGGYFRYLVKAPKLLFERRPGGLILTSEDRLQRPLCLNKMRIWGYFVANSIARRRIQIAPGFIRVLWVGRLLRLKRVDTIIKAVGGLVLEGNRVQLDIYGVGPALAGLMKLAAKYGEAVRFHPPVKLEEVRSLMRSNDVYVLSSDGREGWGAVLSEAIEEGMMVVGTYESGSAATLLQSNQLFHAGDWKRLRTILLSHLKIGLSFRKDDVVWDLDNAAKYLLSAYESRKL